MYIDKNIIKYSCYSEDTILHALEKISLNKEKIVFIINDNGVLEGVLTDGDFRRWLISEKQIDVFIQVNNVTNFIKVIIWGKLLMSASALLILVTRLDIEVCKLMHHNELFVHRC